MQPTSTLTTLSSTAWCLVPATFGKKGLLPIVRWTDSVIIVSFLPVDIAAFTNYSLVAPVPPSPQASFFETAVENWNCKTNLEEACRVFLSHKTERKISSVKFYWRKIGEDNLGCLVKKMWLLEQHQPCQPQLKQKCNQEKLLEMFTFTSSLQIKAELRVPLGCNSNALFLPRFL